MKGINEDEKVGEKTGTASQMLGGGNKEEKPDQPVGMLN